MTTQPLPQPGEPDDLMALADAVGVTPTTAPRAGAHDDIPGYRPHPAVWAHLTDPALDAVVSAWARDIAYREPVCGRCGDTGLVDARCWFTKQEIVISCLDCTGDPRDDRQDGAR